VQRVTIDPDKGFPDLIRQLGDDSKRLLGNEVRLAKLETGEALHRAGRGALWLGVSFGVAVVAIVAATLFVATAIGRVASGHYWLGALITAAVEIGLGVWLVKRGLQSFTKAPYSLPETRSGLRVIKSG
jgi:hypothetical protein